MSPSGVQYIYLSFGRKGKRARARVIFRRWEERRGTEVEETASEVCVCVIFAPRFYEARGESVGFVYDFYMWSGILRSGLLIGFRIVKVIIRSYMGYNKSCT